MIILRDSSEAEMVLLFLQTEIESSRFGDAVTKALEALSLPVSIIKNGDIRNPGENALRAEILEHYREFLSRSGLFSGFPKNIVWQWLRLTPTERGAIRYMNYDYWIELSGGTRQPKKAAENIRNGITVFGITHDHMPAQAEALDIARMPPIIVLCDKEHSDMIALEGHVRLTWMALAGDRIGDIDMLAGICPAEELQRWDSAQT